MSGNSLGVYVRVTAVAFGVGAIVERSIAVFSLIKLLGATYLIYLGIQAIHHRKALTALFDQQPTRATQWRVLREGLIVGIANPEQRRS